MKHNINKRKEIIQRIIINNIEKDTNIQVEGVQKLPVRFNSAESTATWNQPLRGERQRRVSGLQEKKK